MDNKDVRILFADDDLLITKVIERVISDQGWIPIIAHSGVEAYNLYMDNHPDVVVLDVSMPGISGFEVAQIIRNKDKATPIIFYSGLAEESFLKRAIELGERFYITKNYSEKLLVAQIKSLLPTSNNDNKILFNERVGYDKVKSQLYVDTETYVLQGIQSRLMKILCDNANKFVSNKLLYEVCWDKDRWCLSYKKQLNKNINRLRQLLGDDTGVSIGCIRGEGYILQIEN